MDLILKKHSIIITIGPTNCGKSTFIENYLFPKAQKWFKNVHYLSSDTIRRDILNESEKHKHDSRMLQVSKQAFSILENRLDNLTQYPLNSDIVLLDATNLSNRSRQFIIDIAKKNHYSVSALLFDYKDRNDYFVNAEKAKADKRVVADAVKIFKESTLKEIDRKQFDQIVKVTSLDFKEVKFRKEEIEKRQPALDHNSTFCIISDIHGCLDELIEAILDNRGFKLEDGLLQTIEGEQVHSLISIGDYLDKGPKIVETIEFLYRNRGFFNFVRGNHEVWVYNFLKGKFGSYEKNKELIDNYFNSILLLQDNEELRNKFFELYENYSYDFIELPNAILTHAPCQIKHLGKTDSISIKNQKTCMYPKEKDYVNEEDYLNAKEQYLSFLNTEAESNQPFHIFGHIITKDAFSNRNKFGIDTGCYAGGKLTTINFTKNQKRPFIKSYSSKQPLIKELNNFFRTKEKGIDLSSIDRTIYNRLKWAAVNKLNFISGTMSPCDKDFENNSLESLDKGIEYFRSKGVKRLIIQPKYMGSRCNLILSKNLEECKMFSRNGYEIREDRLNLSDSKSIKDLYKELQLKYKDLFEELNAKRILFDGELLPWNVMGKGLIAKDFILPAKAIFSEINLLKENGFEEAFTKMNNKFQNQEVLSEHEMKIYHAYLDFKNEFEEISQIEENLNAYNKQLEIFGSEGTLEFKPFAILKVFTHKGEENWINSTVSNITMFEKLSDSPFAILDFDLFPEKVDGNWFKVGSFLEGGNTIEGFWDFITKQKEMEGVVIKPEKAYVPGVAPYMKCRNPEYLRLTYGINYKSLPIKFNKLINRKSIKRKLETSIKEYELGRQLLDIPSSEISLENPKWTSLAYQLMVEQDREKELDPRL